jgi:hypothetical protein
MNNYEKRLLGHLQEDKSKDKADPLGNVKEAMGSLAYVSGNPLTKTMITLNIENFSTTLVGRFPVLPIYLFGLTDYYSNYVKASIVTPLNGMAFGVVPAPVNAPFFGIVGKDLSQITANGFAGAPFIFNRGDLMMGLMNDDWLTVGLNTFADIRVSCQNVAYGTFLNSFVSDLITISMMRFIVPIANINTYINPIKFTYQDLFGKTTTDSIDPRTYITSTDFQQQICDIPINLPIDKALIMTLGLDFNCPRMSIVLFVEKIEPLTHKNNLSKR